MATATLAKGALWMQNVDYPASWDRTLIDALYADEGVVDGFAVTPGGGLNIDVAGGRAVIQGDEVANQGKYLVDEDAVATLLLSSIGVTRTEYVYLAINDAAVAGGRPGNNVTIETSTTPPGDTTLLLATLTLPAGTSTITAGMIADNRVIVSTVPDGSVTAAKIASGAVGTTELADDAVTNAKIGPGAVGSTELASGAVTSAKIGAGAVGTTELADDAVTNAKIGPGAVGTTELADDAVTQPKIGPGAVGSTELASGAVGASQLASGAVTNAKLGADAVNGSKIANDSINSEHYVDGSIDTAHIANGQVTLAKMADSGAGGTLATGPFASSKVRYVKIAGWVFVQAQALPSASSAATLPSGYRPAYAVHGNLWHGYEGGGLFSIETNGRIDTSGFPSVVYFSICFPAS